MQRNLPEAMLFLQAHSRESVKCNWSLQAASLLLAPWITWILGLENCSTPASQSCLQPCGGSDSVVRYVEWLTREIRRLKMVKPAADSWVAVMWDTWHEDVSFGNVVLSALGAGMDAGMLQSSQLCWVPWIAPWTQLLMFLWTHMTVCLSKK